MVQIILFGNFNLNYLSKAKNYEVILMANFQHLPVQQIWKIGKPKMSKSWPRYLAFLSLI